MVDRRDNRDLGWVAAVAALAPVAIKGASELVKAARSRSKPGRKPKIPPAARKRIATPNDLVAWGNGTVTVRELHEMAREGTLRAQQAGQALEAAQRELASARSLAVPAAVGIAGLAAGWLLTRSSGARRA